MLDVVDVFDEPRERLGGVWHGQQIVEEANVMR